MITYGNQTYASCKRLRGESVIVIAVGSATKGRINVSVLPLPVPADTRTSFPFKSEIMTCICQRRTSIFLDETLYILAKTRSTVVTNSSGMADILQ